MRSVAVMSAAEAATTAGHGHHRGHQAVPRRHPAGRPRRPGRPARPHPLAQRDRRRRAGTTASRWRGCRSWPNTGAPATTGARTRPGSTSSRTSPPRSTARTSTSSTSARPNPDALALILTHGWPGSFLEFLDVIEPLSRDFHLVIPSIPGFGFSGPTHERGWDVVRVARAWAELMRRLGYERYGAQGGDFGSGISRDARRRRPEQVVGVHVNYLPTPRRRAVRADLRRRPSPAGQDRAAHGEPSAYRLQAHPAADHRLRADRLARSASSPGSPRGSTSGPTPRSPDER